MQIAGIQKLTLVDFPGHVAATVFTRGCSFRCGFCHNPELVLPERFNPLLSEKQIFEFLESRYGKLNGICITGGEPLMNRDADKFISHLKALGFDVKLDTNGSFPDMLEKIIKDGDVDYVAMDVKSPLSKYSVTAGIRNREHGTFDSSLRPSVPPSLESKIMRSIDLIRNSGIDYEFRTTISHPIHEPEDFEKMGEMIKGAKRYFLQNYKKSKRINEEIDYEPFTDEELEEAQKIMKKYVNDVGIR